MRCKDGTTQKPSRTHTNTPPTRPRGLKLHTWVMLDLGLETRNPVINFIKSSVKRMPQEYTTNCVLWVRLKRSFDHLPPQKKKHPILITRYIHILLLCTVSIPSLRLRPTTGYLDPNNWLKGASQVTPANEGDTGDRGSIPGSGRFPGEGNGNPLQSSCLENPMDREGWQAAVHGVTKSHTWTEWLSMQLTENMEGSREGCH